MSPATVYDVESSPQSLRQRTLAGPIHCSGVGLHSGAGVTMRLLPAAPDSGIVFRRDDLPGQPTIAADWRSAVESPLCSTLRGADGVEIATVEHLMAAFAGLGIDNATVALDGPEVPIMDGSAAPFVFLVECAGVAEQAPPRRAIRVRKEVRVGDSERWASLRPGPAFSLAFEIDFPNPVVARQSHAVTLAGGVFKSDLARARTFGFRRDIDQLRALGLARGGSLDNAIVVDDDGILNREGLRYDDEFVRHKLLDSVGDLYLAGGPIIGRFEAYRSGHALTLRLVRELMENAAAWEAATLPANVMTPAWQDGPLARSA